MTQFGHTHATGREAMRQWAAPGAITVVAVRQHGEQDWRIERGPATLIGRRFRHIRDARIACKQVAR